MAGANSNIQITNLDFDSIKSNFINYLQGQSTFQDYNFEGSGLNVLLDVLAYNTQYNAYYLNQVANEMFLDSAVQRGSVVSQAKVLGYIPKSAIAPTATVNVVFTNVTAGSLTLPAYQSFGSAPINGINYTFTNPNSYTANKDANNKVVFEDVEIKQAVPATYSFTVDSSTNPNYIFEIPDNAIDTTTLQVIVQQSSANSSYTIYTPATNELQLTGASTVYFLQEALNGNYQIYFGDGVLGQKLSDGNIVIVNYLSTEGTSGAGANSFVLLNTVSGYSPSAVISITPADAGGDKETIDSIKFQAPKSYAAQGRAVTKSDYITAIQENSLGISFDAVNVWGGEENNPPVYGQAFICLKPAGAYTLTATQKTKLISDVISPISVLTVKPTIVDPDYTYITVTADVLYDPSKTTLTSSQIQFGVTSAIQNFASSTLNTFNSSFNAYDLLSSIQNYDKSIITSDFKIKLQKKFFPNLSTSQTYNFYYNTELEKGVLLSGISNSPDLQFLDPTNLANTITGVFIEEVPSTTYGVDTISVINPGYSYQSAPTVTISGDGTGATAQAIITGGAITAIKVLTSGNNYTSAIATITPQPGDTTGQGGAAVINLQGRYGTLRTYYYNSNQVKTILNSNIGTVDYTNGIITLTNFNPSGVDNPLGQLAISATPTTSIISSTQSGIITVDPFDPSAITVNVTAKTTS